MALPGTPGQRISDLCNGNHITQKELAEKIGVSASQLSRIVSGETRTVSSDILIGVAKEFKATPQNTQKERPCGKIPPGRAYIRHSISAAATLI